MTITSAAAAADNPPFTTAGLRRGIIDALPFIISNGVAGMIMGVAYKGLGLGFVPALLFSTLVYSGTAQAVTLGMWASPPPIAALILACIATNARYLVMSAHLRQYFGAVRRRMMLPILFLLADASWMMTTAEAERTRPDAGYLLGSSLPMAMGWIGGTALAFGLPLRPTGPLATAAALLPVAFIVTLLPTQWRGRKSFLPWALSATVAALVVRFCGPSWSMLVGGAVGTAVSLTQVDNE